jgi:hypothetical protein
MEGREKYVAKIREQNDQFRGGLPAPSKVPGCVVITQGIQELTNDPAELGKYLASLFEVVRTFEAFDETNDPYGEHDFGAFDFLEQRVFWKIDYYAPDMLHGSEDPTDLENTIRVLTVMLAREY